LLLVAKGAHADHEPSASLPAETAAILARAEAAFEKGDFEASSTLAARIPDGDPVAGRARYLQGYAAYKLRNLETADRLLGRARSLEPSDEVTLLHGLVAYELGRFPLAIERLESLVASKRAPWAKVAGELVQRARSAIAARARAESLALHGRLIAQAEGELRARRMREAQRTLDAADRALPGQLLSHYYRGYLAYETGDELAARRHLRAALRLSPRDEWSRYMLALSLDEGALERKTIFKELSTSASDPAVRDAARRALSTPAAARPRHGLSLQLELGTGLDTNPSYAADSAAFVVDPGAPPPGGREPPPGGSPPLSPPPGSAPTTSTESGKASALALRGAFSAAYRRELAAGHQGTVGVRLLEQGYLVGGADASKTELSGSVEYAFERRTPFQLRTSYDYTLHLFDHAPLLSQHELGLTPRLQLRSWLWLGGSARLRYRQTHDDDYRYLSAFELSFTLALTARAGRLTLLAGYQLQRGWADAVSVVAEAVVQGRPSYGDYLLDLSALAHGPELELELRLPFRLTFHASAWLLLYDFVSTDRLQSSMFGTTLWQADRRDTQLLVAAELRRPLGHGLEVALVYGAIDSFSSLGSDAPLDFSYSRRMLTANLRFRWPLR
jgi:tetratricopeptide (TPR) repeat protein